MVGARHREQVMRGEDEVLPHLRAALDLPRHQAGDVEDDLLVIDGRHPPRRGPDVDRDIGVMIGQRRHPRGLAQREEGKGHQRALAPDLAGQRAVEVEQVALRAGRRSGGTGVLLARGGGRTGHVRFHTRKHELWGGPAPCPLGNQPRGRLNSCLMASASPASWEAIVAADRLLRDNREKIEGCRQAARKADQPVRCTIQVGVKR